MQPLLVRLLVRELTTQTPRVGTGARAGRGGLTAGVWRKTGACRHLAEGTGAGWEGKHAPREGKMQENPFVGSADPTGAAFTDRTELFEADSSNTYVESYGVRGFVINGASVIGPVVCFRTLFARWNLPLTDTDPDAFAPTVDDIRFLQHITQLPDIVLLGTGKRLRHACVDEPIRAFVRDTLKARLEVLDTPNAINTFNVVAAEGRSAVALLRPWR